MRYALALAIALVAGSVSTTASAHLLPKQHATMRIVDNSAFFVVAVPASALHDVDDDSDGLISPREVQRHEQYIVRQFARGFHVESFHTEQDDAATWLTLPHTDNAASASDYLVVLHRVDFAETPRNPTVEINLFGADAGEDRYAFRASSGPTVENVILAPESPVFTFFTAS